LKITESRITLLPLTRKNRTQTPDAGSRLIVRSRNGYAPALANHIIWHIVEPIAFVMENEMLRGLKRRAEFYARSGNSTIVC
jgi:hypothetical protein